VEFKHGNTNLDFQNLPFVDNEFIELPRNQSLAERSSSNADDILVALNWSHQFNDAWPVKHQILSRQVSMNGDQTFVTNFDLENNVAERYRYVSGVDNDLFATVLDLTGHFETLGLKHTLLAGGDYYRQDYYNFFTQISGYDADFNFVDPSRIDIYHPVHPGTPPINQLPLLNVVGYTEVTDNYGLYAQDQIQLPYNVHVMGGLRYQYVHITSSYTALTDDAVTPRVGILWQPQSWLSVYSNYVENFGANSGRGFGGNP
jgi:iron complex outermembrane receptor protein